MKNNDEKSDFLSGLPGGELVKNRDAITKLAKSGEAHRLMELLNQIGGVKEAAKAATSGKPEQLMEMMNCLMNTEEGAQLVETISNQAKKAGLQ